MLNGIDGLIYQSASQGNLLGEGRTPFIARLNFDRERIARDLPFPIVLWLESESLTLLLKQAPDFTQWISGHFHFGGPAAEAKALDRLFEVYKSLPSQPAAETRKQLEEFSGLLQELNETRGSGDAVTLRKRLAVLGALGERYYRLSDFRMAQKHWTEALQIARKLNDRRAESSVLGNLGLAYAALGEAHRAIEFYKNQLVIAREIGDRCGEGAATGNLGNAYRQLGDTRRAIEFYEKQLMITREIGDRRGEGNALGSLGMAYGALGDTRRAIEFYEQRLAIAREIEDPRGEGSSLFNMGLALDKLGDRTQAIARAEAALRIFEQIEDPNAAKVR
jgi:tetratricopeptide (TPR) repeat protein